MTPRQRLIRLASSQLLENNIKAFLQQQGQVYTEMGYPVAYVKIKPRTRQMCELIENAAMVLGGGPLAYYMESTDRAYKRLETEIWNQTQRRN